MRVKIKLIHENKNMASILFLVIAVNARPVEKASIDTPNANKNIPNKDKSIVVSSSFFTMSIRRLIAIKSKIHPKKRFMTLV